MCFTCVRAQPESVCVCHGVFECVRANLNLVSMYTHISNVLEII